MNRYVVDDFTFSDGTSLPAGTVLGVSSESVHRDPRVYEDPERFDGFRFVKMKEHAVLEGHPDKNFDVVATSAGFVAFGQGRHACPGRYFASAEIKLILAHIVTTYDVKLVEDRPADLSLMGSLQPNPATKVYFRRRQ
jgi:cytochrome P450